MSTEFGRRLNRPGVFSLVCPAEDWSLEIGSSLFSMEWSGANGCQQGDSLNSELPYAIQTPTRLAMIA